MRSRPFALLALCGVAASGSATLQPQPERYLTLGDEGGKASALVAIGGEHGFAPGVYAEKWNGEAWLSLATSGELAQPFIDRGALAARDEQGRLHRFYPLDDDRLEWEIVIDAPPESNVVEFRIDYSEGLTFTYQAPLTPALIEKGYERPENVIGSWAIYYAKSNNQYKTGKFAHIYRPELIDANGVRVWADLDIDPAAHRATLVMPSEWLATAAYPVIIDPTIGYTTTGASLSGQDNLHAQLYQASASGNANPGTFYVWGHSTSGGNLTIWGGAYSSSGSGDTDPAGESALHSSQATITVPDTEGTPQWNSAPITWTGITGGTYYWISVASVPDNRVYFDNGTGAVDRYADGTFSGMPNPWTSPSTGTDGDFRNSWYIDFTSATLEQEGFRWGVDDGNEASHTFEAAQDTNISIADNQSRLLRTLVNATNDPDAIAYTLRYQKNGSGGYVAVPVGSTTNGSISNQLVAASSDDAQQIGTTMTLTGTTIGGSLDATTDWAAMRFTNIAIPPGATITSASVGVVPSGTGEDEPLVTVYLEAADDCATFTTTASDISNRSRTTGVSWSSTDLGANGSTYFSTPDLTTDFQAVINRGGWASGNDVCVIIQGGATSTRDLTIEAQDLGPNTNPPRLSVAWTVPNQVYVTTSANITAGGEATTARLTAPSGKSTSDFVTGRRWDDENGSDSIDITTDDYTEVEWLVFIASSAADGDYFDFRTYAGAAALDTYTVTPRWTIPVPGGGSIIPKVMHNRRQRTLH